MVTDSSVMSLSLSSPRDVAGKLVFACMVLSVLVVATLSLVIGLKLVGRTFAGFTINQRLMVNDMSQYNWTGAAAGLKYPDRILKVDGKSVGSIRDFELLVGQAEAGQAITYTLEKEGRILDVAVRAMRFTWRDFLVTFVIYIVMGLAYLLIGSTVYVMKPNREVSWALLLACYFLGLSMLSASDDRFLLLVKLNILVQALLPASGIHFAMLFPKKWKIVTRYPRLPLVPYAVSALLVLPVLLTYPLSDYMFLMGLVHLTKIFSAFVLVGGVLAVYLRKSFPLERQRAKVILFGAALAFPIPAATHVLTFWGSKYGYGAIPPNFSDIPVVFFPASIAYAVARHNLFDVDLYIKRAVGYSIMTALIGLSYFGMELGIRAVVSQSVFGDYSELIYTILFALLIVFLFNPARDALQRGIDRFFYRLEYDSKEVMQKIGESFRSLLTLDEIVKNVLDTALGTMFIDSGCVLVLNPARLRYECVASGGTRELVCSNGSLGDGQEAEGLDGDRAGARDFRDPPDADDSRKAMESKDAPDVEGAGGSGKPSLAFDVRNPLMERIRESKSEISIYDIQEDPQYAQERAEYLEAFNRMESSLVVPLVHKDQVTGLISVGNKKSGKFYKREDIDLLKTLANQSAVAIENARLLGEVIEKERMEEELSIARDLQMSMLPASCPEIEGFQIAALSLPAREVGGDFYDFVDMGPGKLGMVIGDVTGKSVSGALVMSASRSIFRMLSEQELTLGEIMNHANRRTKKDIKSGMFVALLFAVVDSRGQSLGISSAGQTQPVHYRSETGEAYLIETEGDSFPLGILEEADYIETQVTISEGDKIVFYTDGIVEAMNSRQELFGFDRLIRLIADRGASSAPDLLKEIMDEVNDFAGGTAQHDDLTVIVLGSVHQ